MRDMALQAQRARERYWADPEKSRSYHRAHKQKHHARIMQAEAKRRLRRKDHALAYARQRYAENKEAVRAATRKWEAANPDKVCARTARRKAAKLNATPAWANEAAILALYAEARRLTQTTTIPHQVDHIVPLQGLRVCGLHVETNMRVIPASENSRKKNHMIDEALK